jgi:transposase
MMPKRIRLRELSKEERKEIARLAKARTEPVNLVMRASVIQAMVEDATLPPSQAGRKAGFATDSTGIAWVKRFNAEGIAGLQDRERAGRPRTHSEEVRSQLISLALQKPRSLGYPHELWTLERLQTAFRERHGTHLSDSTIWTWLDEEGLKWKRQQSWFHEVEKHDPEFAEKRGASSDVT